MIKNKPKYWTKKLEKKFDSLIVKCFSDKATDTEKEAELITKQQKEIEELKERLKQYG